MTKIIDLDQMQSPVAGGDEMVVRDASTGIDKRANYDILVRDPLRVAVEAQTGGRITVLYDDLDQPSYMHVLPKFRYEDLGFDTALGTGVCTAFLVGGVEKSEVFVGVYAANIQNNRALSLPFQEPAVSITWDNAKARCEDKGVGWHLMTMHEWAAVALWCAANGFQPRGNTDYTRAHDATHEVGVATTQDSGLQIKTGSGPSAWRHTNDPTGIADLVGNVWEWQWGVRLQDARVHAAPDNDWTLAEANWVDTTVDLPAYSNDTWSSTATAGTQLTDRLLVTRAGINLQGSIWTNTAGERFPIRGGARNAGGSAGLAALYLIYARSDPHGNIGFRPAFVS